MKIEIVDRLDEGFEFQVPAQTARGLEIMAHALAQIARFAHIDDRAEPVAHQVNARFVRQDAQLLANVIGQ